MPLPFTFTFYGTDYTTAFVSTNGNLNFLGRDNEEDNGPIPGDGEPERWRSTRSGTT